MDLGILSQKGWKLNQVKAIFKEPMSHSSQEKWRDEKMIRLSSLTGTWSIIMHEGKWHGCIKAWHGLSPNLIADAVAAIS